MKKADYTKEALLGVLSSYHRMIERSGAEYPTVVLGDIKKSIETVLRVNEYGGIDIEYPMDFENGYKIQTVFANRTENGNYGDIYDFPSDVSLNHPGAEILTGYCVIAEASGLVAEGCNTWNETIAAAIKDYEEHVILSLEQDASIEIIAYQKYKKDWLQQRNYKEDIFDEIKTGYEQECKEHGKTQSFEQYFEEYGIYGEIYCCFDEFLDNEYQDEEYMKDLLTATEYEEYLNERKTDTRVLKDKIQTLKSAAQKKGGELFLDEKKLYSSNHLNCFWYNSGQIASFFYKDFVCSIEVCGDVSLSVLDNEYDKVILDYKKPINSGAYGNAEVMNIIKNDSKLKELEDDGRIDFSLNNWVELRIFDAKGQKYETDIVLDDNILAAVNNFDTFIEKVEAILREREKPSLSSQINSAVNRTTITENSSSKNKIKEPEHI